MREPFIQAYGEEYFKKTWSLWVNAMEDICEQKQGNLCKEMLSDITCKTLIIHGAKDALVFKEHPDYLKNHIANSE